MLRNSEVWRALLLSLGVAVAATVACAFFSPVAAVICAAGSLAVLGIQLVYTRRRYRALAQMADYLRGLAQNYTLPDMRDSEEGELSLLRDEIYKLVYTLLTQKQQLAEEREGLRLSLQDISHQMKTPLTSIQMLADLLQDEALPKEQRTRFLLDLAQEGARMEWLVLTLLKQAQLDAGAVQMQPVTLPAAALVAQAAQAVQVLAEVCGVELALPADTGVLLHCDPAWTREALANLLKNGIEHTPAGGCVTVSVGQNPLEAWVGVEDTGPGIPEEELPKLFQRFYRGSYAAASQTGIGLALARSIQEKQSGDISVQSRVGVGTCFTMHFYKAVF